MTNAQAVVRQAGEGERFWFAGGGVFTMKASAAETGGSFTMFEDHVVRGKTTPYHRHPEHDELIYLLDGEVLVDVEGDRHTIRAGGLIFAPRGVAHAFLVTSETAHLLALLTPGDGESFYREASEPVRSEADAQRPGDFARLGEVAERSPVIDILGPPPFGPTDAEPAALAGPARSAG